MSMRPMFMAVLLLLNASCGRDTPSTMENGRIDPGGAIIAIADSPRVSIAGVGSETDSIFFLSIVGALSLPSGETVVAEGNQRRLIYLNDLGELEIAVGRRGDGPGEFNSIAKVSKAEGIGLVVWDGSARKASFFDSDGQLFNAISLQSAGPQEMVGMVVDDGSPFVVATVPSTGSQNVEGKVIRVWDMTGQLTSEFSGPPEYLDRRFLSLRFVRDGREVTSRTDPIESGCLPSVMAATTGREIVVADSYRGELYSYERDGSRRLIHRTEERAVLTESAHGQILQQIDDFVRESEAPRISFGPDGAVVQSAGRLVEDSKEEFLGYIGNPGGPLTSAWSELFVDGVDRIWLKKASCLIDDPTDTWQVFDSDGALIAAVAVPSGLSLLSADAGHVIAKTVDEFGVEYLNVFDLVQ